MNEKTFTNGDIVFWGLCVLVAVVIAVVGLHG